MGQSPKVNMSYHQTGNEGQKKLIKGIELGLLELKRFLA